jgi:hypothetical protein
VGLKFNKKTLLGIDGLLLFYYLIHLGFKKYKGNGFWVVFSCSATFWSTLSYTNPKITNLD